MAKHVANVADINKGDSVILCGFTGIKLGVFEVVKADKKSITILKKDGSELVFDRKTGDQTNAANAKYAGFIIEDDGSYVAPQRTGAKKKVNKAKSSKKVTAKEVEEDIEELDDEEEEEIKPAKKGKKSSKKKVVIEDDEDEYEEI